jgi:hypothetical protein
VWIELARENYGRRFQDTVRAAQLEHLTTKLADLLTLRAGRHVRTQALTRLADQLETVVATGSPEQAKELLRLLIKEIRVHDRHRIFPTYRIPAVRTTPTKVGRTGYCAKHSPFDVESESFAI